MALKPKNPNSIQYILKMLFLQASVHKGSPVQSWCGADFAVVVVVKTMADPSCMGREIVWLEKN